MSSSNDISSDQESNGVANDAIEQVKLNPSDWAARKLAASILYDFKKHSEAADLLWSAPELPYRSQDIAFSVRIIAKDRPDNAIRIVKKVMKRNGKNAEGCLLLAKAFHKEGMPLLASRMYGAALAVSNENFDIGFEQESLWFDDLGELVSEWQSQSFQPQPNEPAPMKDFLGGAISFLEYTQRVTARVSVSADLKVSDNPKLTAPTLPIAPITPAHTEPSLTPEVSLPKLKPVLAFGGVAESPSVSNVSDTPKLDSPKPTSEPTSSESDPSENKESPSTPKILAPPAFSPRKLLVTPSPNANTVPLFIPGVKPVDESK